MARTDGQTDRQTDGRTDGGDNHNIPTFFSKSVGITTPIMDIFQVKGTNSKDMITRNGAAEADAYPHAECLT